MLIDQGYERTLQQDDPKMMILLKSDCPIFFLCLIWKEPIVLTENRSEKYHYERNSQYSKDADVKLWARESKSRGDERPMV